MEVLKKNLFWKRIKLNIIRLIQTGQSCFTHTIASHYQYDPKDTLIIIIKLIQNIKIIYIYIVYHIYKTKNQMFTYVKKKNSEKMPIALSNMYYEQIIKLN